MFVPFGAIPSHLMEPLHIDTTLQYNLRKLKLPKSKERDSNKALLLAPPICDISSSNSDSLFTFSFCDNRPEIADLTDIPDTITDWESVFSQAVAGFEEVECPLQSTESYDWLTCSMASHSELCDTSVTLSDTEELETMSSKTIDNKEIHKVSQMYSGAPLHYKCSPRMRTDNEAEDDSYTIMEEEIDSLFSQPIEMQYLSGNKPMELPNTFKHHPRRSTVFSNDSCDCLTEELSRRDTVSGLHELLLQSDTEPDVVTYAILTNVAHIWETPISSLPH